MDGDVRYSLGFYTQLYHRVLPFGVFAGCYGVFRFFFLSGLVHSTIDLAGFKIVLGQDCVKSSRVFELCYCGEIGAAI